MKKQRKHYQPDEKSPSLGDVYWTRRRSRPSTMNWACSPRFLPLAKRSSSKTGAVAFGQKHGRIIPPKKNGPLIRRKAIGERCRNFRGAGATLLIAQSFHWINARRAELCYGSYAGGNAHHALEDLTAASTQWPLRIHEPPAEAFTGSTRVWRRPVRGHHNRLEHT